MTQEAQIYTIKLALPKYVAKILMRIEQHGFEAFIVGGCVRDSLLGLTPKDWDITSNATPTQIQQIFSQEAEYKILPIGIQYGTLGIFDRGAQKVVEITTYRTDGSYTDGRRPQSVCFAKTLQEDVSRRDFTINALACQLAPYTLNESQQDSQVHCHTPTLAPTQKSGRDSQFCTYLNGAQDLKHNADSQNPTYLGGVQSLGRNTDSQNPVMLSEAKHLCSALQKDSSFATQIQNDKDSQIHESMQVGAQDKDSQIHESQAPISANNKERKQYAPKEFHAPNKHNTNHAAKIPPTTHAQDSQLYTLNLFDYYGGMAHLDSKIIVCVGDSKERLREDSLRILRALRFSATLPFGFTLHSETKEAIHALHANLEHIAKERISAELKRLLCGQYAYKVVPLYYDVFSLLFPLIKGFPPHQIHKNAAMLKGAPNDFALRLALLLYSDSHCDLEHFIQEYRRTCQNLRFENALIQRSATLLQLLCATQHTPPISMYDVLCLLTRHDMEVIMQLFCLHVILHESYCKSFDKTSDESYKEACSNPHRKALNQSCNESHSEPYPANCYEHSSKSLSAFESCDNSHYESYHKLHTESFGTSHNESLNETCHDFFDTACGNSPYQSCGKSHSNSHSRSQRNPQGKFCPQSFGNPSIPDSHNDSHSKAETLRAIMHHLMTIIKDKKPYRLSHLAINGTMLQELAATMGVKLQGKQIGFILQELLDLVLREEIMNNESALLDRAGHYLTQNI